jgi:hypothetical protein
MSLSAEQQSKFDTIQANMARQDKMRHEIVEEIIEGKRALDEVARNSVALSWYSKVWLRVAKIFGRKSTR